MSLNSSSKLCFSKRLVIVSLLLFFVGLSVIVFSTLSSSVNKTTSSKASGSESVALKDIGLKNQPCIPSNDGLSCTIDYNLAFPNLVCSAPLDFWMRVGVARNSYANTKCIEYSDIPMGSKGNLCRKAELGKRQCDAGLTCIDVYDDEADEPHKGSFSKTFLDYFISVYKNKGIKMNQGYVFEIDDISSEVTSNDVDKYSGLKRAMGKFTYFNDNKNPFLPQPRGICIPVDNLPKAGVVKCGDAGQKICRDESNGAAVNPCFGNNRPFAESAADFWNTSKCVPKIDIKSKGLVRCDGNGWYRTCDEFCLSNNAKCVETCEDKVLVTYGDESKEMMVKGGTFTSLPDKPKMSGTCGQHYPPQYSNDRMMSLWETCGTIGQTFCCCDKIK